ncbi:hypothetical protein [Xanthomonas phage BUDD]|nr:hypothetical protein [Xanthomonas phage BUDD]
MKTQKDAIRRELLDRATGKGREPTWDVDVEPTKLELVKALNFYSATVEPETLKKYAITWARKNAPESLERVQAQPDWKFQTYGALMRIDSRGLKIPKAEKNSIAKFVNELIMPFTEPKQIKPRKKKMSTENVNYRNFCDALDKATEATEFVKPDLTVDKKHSTASVIETCQRELEAIKEDGDIYPKHMTQWFTYVMKLMNGGKMPEKAPKEVKKRVETVVVDTADDGDDDSATTTRQARAPRTPKKVASAKGPKTPTLPKNDPVPAADHVLNGKKVAFLFDTRYGRLTRMVSDSKNGFEIKGKTIHNIDHTKSKVALLKNFGDAMQPGKNTEEELVAWMGKCVKKGNPISVGSRLAEEVLVLEAA